MPGLVLVGFVVVVGLVGVGVNPTTPTQKYASPHIDWQLSPTPVFQVVNCLSVMLYLAAMSEQNSPGRWR